MKRILFFVVAICVYCFSSCRDNSDAVSVVNAVEKQTQDTVEIDSVKALPVGDNSKNSLDWEGVYYGVLPCANCEGVETELTIKYDNTFELKIKYIGKGNEKLNSIKGKFVWNSKGSIVILSIDDTTRPNQYFVGENQLIQLDMKGEKILGDLASSYVLKKRFD